MGDLVGAVGVIRAVFVVVGIVVAGDCKKASSAGMVARN